MRRNFKGKSIYGSNRLLRAIDSGGNGEVWLASNTERKLAIKLCKKDGDTPNQRFRDEVQAMQVCSDIAGVIEVYESYLPSDYKAEVAYYTMPLGVPVASIAKPFVEFDLYNDMNGEFRGGLINRMRIIAKLATALANIHSKGIYHRDIKPSNLLLVNDNPVFIDFGLATFPDKTKVSRPNEQIGPYTTMPPEVKQRLDNVSPEAADVYSFAKSCWMILTGNYIGFDGQYSKESVLGLERYFPDFYPNPLHGYNLS